MEPRSTNKDYQQMAESNLLITVLNFCLYYTNFWPNIILSGIVNIAVLISGFLVYDKSSTIVGLFVVFLVY